VDGTEMHGAARDRQLRCDFLIRLSRRPKAPPDIAPKSQKSAEVGLGIKSIGWPSSKQEPDGMDRLDDFENRRKSRSKGIRQRTER
jgi:hypothetical protein